MRFSSLGFSFVLLTCSLALSAAASETPTRPDAAAVRAVPGGRERASVALPSGVDLGALMRQVHFAFRPRGDALAMEHASYAIEASRGRVRLSVGRGPSSRSVARESVEFETSEISRDGRSLLDMGASTYVGTRGQLAIDRGMVRETWTNGETGSEQAWRLATRPEGRSELVVVVDVRGLDHVGTTQSGLHFAGSSGLGVRYGHATWVDAAGRRVPVRAVFEDGRIVMRVPASVVDAATYPVVLDPVVGPERAVDDPVVRPVGQAESASALAFDGTNHLVVWVDGRGYDFRVYGARVGPDGSVLDPLGIPISRSMLAHTSASVAFDGTNYLVAFGDDRNGSDQDIYATRVSVAGVVLDPDGIGVSTASADQRDPAIAFDGTNYLVAFTDARRGDGGDIYAARVDVAGELLDPQGFAVSSATGTQSQATVASDGTSFLVAWTDQRSGATSDVYGARVSSAGAVLDPAGIALCTAPNSQSSVSIASDGAAYLVVWSDARNESVFPPNGTDIYGTRLTTAGMVVEPAGLRVSSAEGSESSPSIAFDGTNYLVVWADTRNATGYDLYGTRISTAGVVLDANGLALSDEDTSEPALSFGGTGYLITWTAFTTGNVVAARVDTAGTPIDTVGTVVSTAGSVEFSPAIAFDGTHHLVVWADVRNGASDIYAARIDDAGATLDPAGIAVSTAIGTQTDPVVASDGTGFLVVWEDHRDDASPPDLYGARVNAAGVVLDPDGIVVSAADGHQQSPAVAFDGTNYLVVWGDTRTTTSKIFGARVDGAGTVLDPSGFSISGDGNGLDPTIVAGGTSSLVVWVSGGIVGARVLDTGEVVDPLGLAIATSAGFVSGARAAFDGTNYLVVWQELLTGTSFDVRAARMSGNGEVLDPQGILVRARAGGEPLPRVAFDGTNYLVVWKTDRDDVAYDLRGARIDGGGTLLDRSGFLVAAGVSPLARWELSAQNATGRVAVAYETAMASAGGVKRAAARILCSTPAADDALCNSSPPPPPSTRQGGCSVVVPSRGDGTTTGMVIMIAAALCAVSRSSRRPRRP